MIDIKKIQKEKSINELLEFSIINIDKPSGPTSFKVDMIVKKELNLKKTSHFGTLDPMVTGVLPVALNRACKLMPYFIGKNKTYVGVMSLHKAISKKDLDSGVKKLVGIITQLPPIRSRVKRSERERTVYSFRILEVWDRSVLFETEVEAGTYIRKLIHNLGEKIGGAHMLELRRIRASIFLENKAVKLPDLINAVKEYKSGNEKFIRDMLIPGEIVKDILGCVQIKKSCVVKLYHGHDLSKEFLNEGGIFNAGEKMSVFEGEAFIGVYVAVNQNSAKPLYVLQPIKANKFP